MAQYETMAGADGGVREAGGAGDSTLGPGGDELARTGAEPGQRGAGSTAACRVSRRRLRRRRAVSGGIDEHRAQHRGGRRDQSTQETAEHFPTIASSGSMMA